MKDNKIEIVKDLVTFGQGSSIRQIANRVKIPYPNVYNIIKKLELDDLVTLEKIGSAYRCSLNKKVHPLIFQAEYERTMDLLEKNTDLKILNKKLYNLNFPFVALIFGSYAKGTASKHSDIDLMIISEINREKEFERTINLLPLDIHPTTLSFDQFMNMAKTNEFSVVSELLDRNIILVGIEDYYRMLEHVRPRTNKNSGIKF